MVNLTTHDIRPQDSDTSPMTCDVSPITAAMQLQQEDNIPTVGKGLSLATSLTKNIPIEIPILSLANIPGLCEAFYRKYYFGMINGVYAVVDREAQDTFGQPIGYQVISLAELKKQYAHLNTKVGGKIVNLVDAIAQSNQRVLGTLVVKPSMDIAEGELNLMRPLAVTPVPHPYPVLSQALLDVLAPNGPRGSDFFADFIAHSAYPVHPGLGVGLLINNAIVNGCASWMVDIFQKGWGLRCVVITHANQFEYCFTRLNRPTLLVVHSAALQAGGRQAEKMLLDLLTRNEVTVKTGLIKPVSLPNYTQIVVLAEAGYALPTSLEKFFCVLDTKASTTVDPQRLAKELFEQEGLAGYLYDLCQRPVYSVNFKQNVATMHSVLNAYQENLVLRFLIDGLENGELADTTVPCDRLWREFQHFIKSHGASFNQIVFGRELHKWLPSISRSKCVEPNSVSFHNFPPVTPRWVTCYIIPDLATCRSNIDRALGMSWQWMFQPTPVTTTNSFPTADQPTQLSADSHADVAAIDINITQFEAALTQGKLAAIGAD